MDIPPRYSYRNTAAAAANFDPTTYPSTKHVCTKENNHRAVKKQQITK